MNNPSTPSTSSGKERQRTNLRLTQLITGILLGCGILAAVFLLKHDYSEKTFVPEAPDYADSTMWYTAFCDSLDTGADIFYIVSTWEEDWSTDDGRISHYADVWNSQHRDNMAIEIKKIAAYMAPGNRFYAPYYRHITIDGWMTRNEDTIHRRAILAMDDVKAAFHHFLSERDNTRPFVLAGFSQGGMAVVELLKQLDKKSYQQLVAAYVLGYKVTVEDTTTCKYIRPAQNATDLGVTICYNTVKDVKYVNPIIASSCCCINPVNWQTDNTPAQLHDTITVTVNPQHHVLVVTGYSGSEYPSYKGFLNVGDIHSCEPWLYSECLKENINIRIQAWRSLHPNNRPVSRTE